MSKQSSIPPSYTRCVAHSVTPHCAQSDRVGLSFLSETGGAIRVAISKESAFFYLNALAGVFGGMSTISQDSMSQGMPNLEVFPHEAEKV